MQFDTDMQDKNQSCMPFDEYVESISMPMLDLLIDSNPSLFSTENSQPKYQITKCQPEPDKFD